MIDFFTDVIENAFNVGEKFVTFEWSDITIKEITSLAEAGISIYAIADLYNISVDVIKAIVED